LDKDLVRGKYNSGIDAREIRKRGMEVKLYVGNLPFSTTEEELRTLFEQAGQVATVDLIKDRDTGRSKGFAFVAMGAQSEAEKAISMFNGYRLENREIKVNLARPREESGRGGYGGSRGGTGGYDRKRSGPPRHDRRGGSDRY
jgi:cold-inducible RNA-binding protein